MSSVVKVVHPDAETIAALAEGRLDAAKLDATLAHVETCKSCMEGLELATAIASRETFAERAPRSYAWWSVAAAAVLAIVIGAPILVRRMTSPSTTAIAQLVELAPRDARLVEPRLAGGFEYAPYRGAMRADTAKDPQRLRLGGAAADAIERADRDRTAAAQHVAGVALLLADDASASLDRLRMAGQQSPQDARIASDLAAALYATALASGRASLYPEALAAADRALRIDPQLAEALFNRALILERLGLTQEARRAWERYLAVDASSKWAEEARHRLASLPTTTSDALFKRELPRLEPQLVRRFPQQSRTYAEAELLGQWGEAVQRGDANDATRLLDAARIVGASLEHEALLRDAVAAIDRADAAQRASLARAHAAYRRGRMAYAKQQLADANRDLEASVPDFERGDSPMSLLARYFVACVLYDRSDVPRARRALEDVLAVARDDYIALRAQTLWELALCAMVENDWNQTAKLATDAETLFARTGERANAAFVRSLLATALMSIGRPDDAWTARIHGFEDLSAEGRGDRLLVGLSAAARMEQRAGRRDTARALLAVEIEEARHAANPFILPEALVRGALLAEHDEATRLVHEASSAAANIRDASLRDLAMANVHAAEGAIALDDDPRRAIDSLTQAIDFYRASNLPAHLPGPYLYRARAAQRLGRADDAQRDLENGIAEVERKRIELPGGIVADPVFDAADALFEDAIRLGLDRNDRARVFALVERRRAQSSFQVRATHPPTLDDLQRRLRGSATVVLHLTSMPDEIVAIAIAENDVLIARTPFPRTRIDDAASDALFDVLIRPTARILDRGTELIVVADVALERVAFAALYDRETKRHLVERVSIALAPTAAALDVDKGEIPRAVVAVALPTETATALPESEREIHDIAPLYRQSRVVQPAEATYAAVHRALQTDAVLHLAGHTTRERDDTALRLADGERATWAKIAADPIDRRAVLVLAACETLRGSSSPHARSLSLGAAFLAAGAESVIGTLTPIPDAEARPLFLEIHRQLAAGWSPAQAVRRAQLDALAGGALPSWKSIAVLTRCIHSGQMKGELPWPKS